MQPARRRGATCAVTGCSGCTRTIQGTVHRTVRRPRARAPGAARSRRGRRRRRAAGEFFGALGAAWPLTAAQRSRLTPAVLAALNAGWTPHELGQVRRGERRRRPEPVRGADRPASGRPGRRGAANATSAPGWPASTATRRTPARAASRRPARSSAAPAQTARTTCMAVLRSRRALAPGRPGAEPTRCTATMRQVPPSTRTRTRSVHAGNDHPGR